MQRALLLHLRQSEKRLMHAHGMQKDGEGVGRTLCVVQGDIKGFEDDRRADH